MKPVSTTVRLSFGLASITMTIMFLALQIGLVPDPLRPLLEGRARLCESIAIQFTAAARYNQIKVIQTAVPQMLKRNPDILSIAVINSDQESDEKYIVKTDNHTAIWEKNPSEQSAATHVQIPLYKNGNQWAVIQICFDPIVFNGFFALLGRPAVQLAFFMAMVTFPAFWFYLRKTIRHLDPAKVIPARVKAILDTLSEGVLVLDDKEQIILANDAFIKATGCSASELQGRKASEIAWTDPKTQQPPSIYPWVQAISQGQSLKSVPLSLQSLSNDLRTFMVNSGPIRGTDGKLRGALVTFDDVSDIEEKNTRLENTLKMLNDSRNKIKQQNDELKLLSMRDPLTGCLNRRAFFEIFETEWSSASRYGYSLGCVMVDVDHFKAVNDNHGHSVGDQVLQKIAQVLLSTARKSDTVCRYGGEEFCVLLSHTDIENSKIVAEKFRQKIEEAVPANISITASFGVSVKELNAKNPQELIDQADKALYLAKDTGRNRVVRWDQMPDKSQLQTESQATQNDQSTQAKEPKSSNNIPFSAVTALVSALEHRDIATALHSRNVADLCVAMAKGLISEADCFVMEIAGLLHDIGKLGVPDSILLKPGPLTKEEWKVMETHDRMGVEIINSSFGSAELTNIVRYCHAWFAGNPRNPELPTGQNIPLRSRIVLITDAYDAMTTDRVYRKAMSQTEAFQELRRCAGTQFDPELVERLIETVLARDENRSAAPATASQEKALRIGLEIERLACAMEAQDMSMLKSIAQHLAANAAKLGLPQIAEAAGNIKQSTTSKTDKLDLMESVNELLELCQSHQSAYLNATNQSPDPQPQCPEETVENK